jgi:hypothetical protein
MALNSEEPEKQVKSSEIQSVPLPKMLQTAKW